MKTNKLFSPLLFLQSPPREPERCAFAVSLVFGRVYIVVDGVATLLLDFIRLSQPPHHLHGAGPQADPAELALSQPSVFFAFVGKTVSGVEIAHGDAPVAASHYIQDVGCVSRDVECCRCVGRPYLVYQQLLIFAVICISVGQ